MITIDRLRKYYAEDAVFVTEHASLRFRQKGIKAKDIRVVVSNGEIIEQYPDNYPYPSCLVYGINFNKISWDSIIWSFCTNK